ncbi:alpha/beta-hydrolase [Macroventuria anomochaeta]|uniref:Alpha/beta-hydrolase n=1 Tax=Macroventuria anomochaeta TaxID=301207 RepID=A0ACB6SAZ1_9PLEO|nr:alpha/beta-hydrolase [Macroventuria anomochaeta]KAF2631301.1 alpha/beta-hydrolase [Macroventuria anomochaeta]
MASPYPPSHTVPPTAPHTHTIIFLHGRGSNATEFCSEIFESQDSSGAFFTELFPCIKWVFPCAEKRWAVTNEEEMHQWFDMASVQRPQEDCEVQISGLHESRQQLLEIVGEEAEEVGVERMIVAGISQGCATAIYTLLISGVRVGGFFGFCGWLPLAYEIQRLTSAPRWNRNVLSMPVLLQHCQDDTVVPFENGEVLRDRLRGLGMQVQWQNYEEGGHWLDEPNGMDGVVSFVKKVTSG